MESRIPPEKKLLLARKIREEHMINRNILRGREAILYGKGSPEPYYEMHSLENGPRTESAEDVSTFKIRAALALFLFLAYFALDTGGGDFFGVTAASVRQEVETDYSEGLFDFADELSLMQP